MPKTYRKKKARRKTVRARIILLAVSTIIVASSFTIYNILNKKNILAEDKLPPSETHVVNDNSHDETESDHSIEDNTPPSLKDDDYKDELPPTKNHVVDSNFHDETESNNNAEDNILPSLDNTSYKDENGNIVIKNTDDILVLVNKTRNLPSDYEPEDLVIPNVKFSFNENLQKKYLRKDAAKALEELFKDAKKSEINLFAVSGYRSYERQSQIFNAKANKYGHEVANKTSAVPGQSEHQTGLAMDVSSSSANYQLTEQFGQTSEGIWLKENAHRFGFIIRYPKDKTDITGYSYEPWHIRYVGKDVAKTIKDNNITFEEYFTKSNNE